VRGECGGVGGGGCGGVGGVGGVGVCRVGSLLTFDIPQTALVATLDTYDFYNFVTIHDTFTLKKISFQINIVMVEFTAT
jgi:hypothetical protein